MLSDGRGAGGCPAIVGIGLDVVAIGRILRSLAEGNGRFEKVASRRPSARSALGARTGRSHEPLRADRDDGREQVLHGPGCPQDERADIPIDRPCPGEELFVLDESLRPVSQGKVGALYIGGVGLSPGYWRDLEKTRTAFLQYPGPRGQGRRIYKTGDLARLGDDGLVYYVARADTQIKSRGYRIKLGEIEAALHNLPSLEGLRRRGGAEPGFRGRAIPTWTFPASAGGRAIRDDRRRRPRRPSV